MHNVVIIGSGCAGNTAAIYTARANLQPLVVGGHEPGGQLSITSTVENFPGFPEGVLGPELVENMKKQAEHFGAEYRHGSVLEADLSQRPFRLNIDGEWVETRTVIIASGASALRRTVKRLLPSASSAIFKQTPVAFDAGKAVVYVLPVSSFQAAV